MTLAALTSPGWVFCRIFLLRFVWCASCDEAVVLGWEMRRRREGPFSPRDTTGPSTPLTWPFSCCHLDDPWGIVTRSLCYELALFLPSCVLLSEGGLATALTSNSNAGEALCSHSLLCISSIMQIIMDLGIFALRFSLQYTFTDLVLKLFQLWSLWILSVGCCVPLTSAHHLGIFSLEYSLTFHHDRMLQVYLIYFLAQP